MSVSSFLVRFCTAATVVSIGLLASQAKAHPQPPGPTLDIANPGPGDVLIPGSILISGVAYDDNAEEGVGVDRVSLFLGDRDEGGLFLGDAKLGLHNPEAVEGGDPQFERAGWRLQTPALKGPDREVVLCFYARSSVSGVETMEEIPVVIGESSGGGEGGGGDE